MTNFKYIGETNNGQVISGVIAVTNLPAAKRAVKLLQIKKFFRLKRIIREKTFLYKAQRSKEKPVLGEQKAYERSEVESVLRKMDYRVLYVRRKLFSLNLTPSYKDIVIFIRICADLLREKLPFDEILQIMNMDIENKSLKKAIREIRADLKDGKDGKEVFDKHQKIFGKFPAYMLGVASTSGDMAGVYESTARFLERNEEFKKSLRQTLIMPGVIMLFMVAAVIFYVVYIFPKTTGLFAQFDIEVPPLTASTMAISEFLQRNLTALLIGFSLTLIVLMKVFKSEKGRYQFDKFVIRLFYIGGLLHKTSIEIFSRVFHVLYSESGDNIKVIRIAAEACRNKFIESQIISVAIPKMVKEGSGLVESLEASGVFTKTALSRFRSGADSGTLKKSSLQLANYYEKETSYKLKSFIDWVNVVVSVVIVLIVIGLTIISSETAVMSPKMPGMNY